MQTKQITVPLVIKQIEDDKDAFTFEGHASTFGNIDLGDDVIERGAFRKSLTKRMPKLLWQHNMHEPLGVFVEAFEDEKGLFVRGKMPKDDKFVAERVIPQMKIGSISSMSIGFSVNDFELRDDIRYLKDVELWEASLVTFPMNPQAEIIGVKSLSVEDASGMDRKEFEQLLRETGCFSRKLCKAIASKFIGQCDADNIGQRDADNEALLKEIGNLAKLYK